jgi:hypothetical protein
LSNPIYVGRIAHKGQIYEGHHPPIVTLSRFRLANQRIGFLLFAVRKARVALARRLAIIMHAMLRDGTEFAFD